VARVIGQLLSARTEAATLYQELRAIGGVQLPHGWLPINPSAEQKLTAAVTASGVSRSLLAEQPAAWELFDRGLHPDQFATLDRLTSVWRTWQGILQTESAELADWSGELGWFDAWQRDGAIWLAELRAEMLHPLQRWGAVLGCLDVLTAAGLPEYRLQLLRGQIDADTAEEAYRRGLMATALAERLRAEELEYFNPELHDGHIAQFEAAAAQLRAALPTHAPAVLVHRRPFDPAERRGRFAGFAAELRRKRGGRSFRELFQMYPDLVLGLTPCVLVSPASAATFLAPDAARFDLVVFDEASQIRVAEAIGAMGRGQSVVVVGDSRQMPPTTIMQASHADDEQQDEDGPVPEDLERILSESVESGLPQRWLSWHYRSQDESLIAFSNRYYYDNKLSSLPSPGTAGTAGVIWRRVAGQFDRGASRTNEVEAKAVVAEIAQRLRTPGSGHSIGVVTFNIQQRDLILNLLEDSADPLIRERMAESVVEPIFVKNLENVQGDERDIIMFSLAFSTNPETGQLPLNFGPLSRTGGERRLNVAVTRARRQVILFASFNPSDIDLSRTAAVGTAHLRAYCEMAAAGVERLGDLASPRQERGDRIRDEIAAAIRQRGHEVTTRYGLSDFTVDIAVRAQGSQRWQVAILLDSPQWSSRPTVADRDCAPSLLRTVVGWPQMLRFWLPAWIRDRSAVLDAVDSAVAAAVAAEEVGPKDASQSGDDVSDAAAAPSSVERPRDTGGYMAPFTAEELTPRLRYDVRKPVVVNSISLPAAPADPISGVVDGGPSRFVPYVPTLVGSQGDIDAIRIDSRVQSAVRETLHEVIVAEGPVEQHRLARLTLARFGFAKTREDRRLAVLELLDPAVLRRHPTGAFAWPSELDPETWRGFRVNQNSSDRDFEEIAPEEVANAIAYALAKAAVMAEEELLRRGLELLGYRRKTEKIDGLLRYGLQIAYQSRRVSRGDDGRYAAPPVQ